MLFTQGQTKGVAIILGISSPMMSLLPKHHRRAEETGGWEVLEGHSKPQRHLSGSPGLRWEENPAGSSGSSYIQSPSVDHLLLFLNILLIYSS